MGRWGDHGATLVRFVDKGAPSEVLWEQCTNSVPRSDEFVVWPGTARRKVEWVAWVCEYTDQDRKDYHVIVATS